ncbi:alpha/beta hydrolase [Pseudonocardia asaccharolytica]|uniref:Esterase n=1 Tax=Pseudonocardia asaccharolytica DSM 44247 = NBRC 16224 TaxID=1123024 RepID=A0A511CXC0_9PSEU|nr:alpha/beta hydrolase [Pseudonocardia asaccharolytica]GEL17205.1 esterase [Pseudonocardia asaccharolytica DSM 44247 = NBRC 16224]
MRPLYRAPSGIAFRSREELNQQYDIEVSVPDFGAYAEQYVGESARARDELTCHLDVSYGPTLDERLDVFPGEPGGPVVVFIHGGYWKSLTSAEFSLVARGPVARGATVVIPTYALCPRVTIDEIVRQHRAAVAWTYRNIANYGADPERLAVVGHSAGGHGAAMVLDTYWADDYGLPQDLVRGACAISGLFDLRPIPYTFAQPDLQFTADQVMRNSPILNLPESAPPLLVTHGGLQPAEMERQSVDYITAWRAAGLPGEYWPRPEFNHFDEIMALTEPDSELTERVLGLAKG